MACKGTALLLLYFTLNIIRLREDREADRVARMGEMRN
jgi:hypothetical protein